MTTAAVGGANKFENLELRLAAHPAIRHLQQLNEAHNGEPHVNTSEDEEEDNDDKGEKAEHEEQRTQQPQLQQAEDELEEEQGQDEAALYESPMMHMYAELLSAVLMPGLPVVNEAEHAPLAGLVTAFPYVQQFMPQPTRAEKKKKKNKCTKRIHASHRLTIPNSYSPTAANATTTIQLPASTYPTGGHLPAEDCVTPPLPAALPAPFRSISTSPTFSSGNSPKELSSENESCSHTNCSSSALADTFASLSPNFSASRLSRFISPLQPPSATFLSTPVFSSSSSSICSFNSFPAHILPSPALRALQQPVCACSPALLQSSHSSLCQDGLQLDKPAWDNKDGQWLGDW